ncbi:MAG: cyclic nucleotide-binding domain-containing protein [Chromatiales bacterium]
MAIPAKTTEACSLCRSKTLCLAKNLTSEQLKGLDTLTRPLGPFKQGDTIFRMEDPFKSLFVIRSGCVKVETITYEGESCVDGFFFAGDLIGLEAIGDRTYRHDAIALEDCLICELPFTQLETLSSFVPHLQHKLLQLLGDKIRLTNETFIYARHLSAEQRLLLFFRLLCQKNIIRRERQDQSIRLPMSKCDIASYLGLRPESLSRALRKLEQKGIIVNHAKTIEFTDIEAILQIVGH